jgi:hypothetical protein
VRERERRRCARLSLFASLSHCASVFLFQLECKHTMLINEEEGSVSGGEKKKREGERGRER